MSEVTVDTYEAVDAFAAMFDGVDDYVRLLRSIRKAHKNGVAVDADKAAAILKDLLVEVMNDAVVLTQGDDADRLSVCNRVAQAVVQKELQR